MGIEVERFIDVNPELICSICHEVFASPMETPCRHVFCSSCIYNWVNRSITRENNCPTCRMKVDHHSIRPALPIIKNILAKQKMHCDCFEHGCKEVVIMEKMKLHLEVCPYQLIPCCHDECITLVMRRNIEKHEKSCVKRKVVCPIGCGGLVVFEEIHNHGCVSILKHRFEENLSQFDEKISCVKDRLISVEERLERLEQSFKNSRSHKLSFLTDKLLTNLARQAGEKETTSDIKQVLEELNNFTKTTYSHLHQRLMCKELKVNPEQKARRRSPRQQMRRMNNTTMRDRSRSPVNGNS